MSSKRRKSGSGYSSNQDAAKQCDLLAVFRRELREHFELPQDLPHQILTLMMALTNQGESAQPPLPPAVRGSSRKSGKRGAF